MNNVKLATKKASVCSVFLFSYVEHWITEEYSAKGVGVDCQESADLCFFFLLWIANHTYKRVSKTAVIRPLVAKSA